MLKRNIGKWEMVFLFINGIIGAGIFGLPSKAFEQAGVYSIAAFVVCAFAVFVIILCFAEVSSRFDKTGGPYVYAGSALGPMAGFLTGWLLLLTRLLTFAALINLFVSYLSVFTDWFTSASARIAAILCLTILLGLLNHIGIRNTTRVNNILTVAKLLPLLVFIIVGFFFIEPGNFTAEEFPALGDFSSTVLLLVFAFGGFESILVNSGEVKNPAKNLPFALLTATSAIAVIYLLIQIVSVGTLTILGETDKPLADAAALFMGSTGAQLISIGALISVLGTLNAVMLVGSRLPYAMSEQRQLPQIFAFVHPKFLTPTWSLIFFVVIVTLVSINYSFVSAASISATARVLIYGIVCIVLIRLRRTQPLQEGVFTLRYGKFLAIIGILISIWLASSAQMKELRDIAVVIGAGIVVFLILKKTNPLRE